MTRSRRSIEKEVDQLADELMEIAPDLDPVEAKAMVWEETNLYEQYRAAPGEAPRQEIAKSDRPYSVGDACADAIAKKADEMAWEEWPGKTVETLRADLWESPMGLMLYELARNRGTEPYYQARVRKSASDRSAWSVLEDWLR